MLTWSLLSFVQLSPPALQRFANILKVIINKKSPKGEDSLEPLLISSVFPVNIDVEVLFVD